MEPANKGRVLFLHGNTEWYGSDRSFFLLSRELRDQGWDVTVGLPGGGALFDALAEAGMDPRIIEPTALRARANSWRWLLRTVFADLPRSVLACRRAAMKAEIVHLNTSILVGGLLGGWLARRPVVLHVRESYAQSQRVWRWYARFLRLFATRLIAISEDVALEANSAGLGNRTAMIPNGLRFKPPRVHVRGDRVVMVARINGWKGQDVLLEALAILRDRGRPVRASIAGDVYPGQEELLHELRSQIARLELDELVNLPGYVSDVDALLREAAVFVSPSTLPEPFGLALVDALSQGIPCVATDAGGPREIIKDEQTGLLVPPGDPSALADAIQRLLHDEGLSARLGAAAAADVRARYSIEMTAHRVGELYLSVLGRGAPLASS